MIPKYIGVVYFGGLISVALSIQRLSEKQVISATEDSAERGIFVPVSRFSVTAKKKSNNYFVKIRFSFSKTEYVDLETYIYIYMCVCVCVCKLSSSLKTFFIFLYCYCHLHSGYLRR